MKGLLTVLSPQEYAAWAVEAGANSIRSFDPADTAAHWGWAWERGK
jgi:cytochrome c oxidase subunit 2